MQDYQHHLRLLYKRYPEENFVTRQLVPSVTAPVVSHACAVAGVRFGGCALPSPRANCYHTTWKRVVCVPPSFMRTHIFYA